MTVVLLAVLHIETCVDKFLLHTVIYCIFQLVGILYYYIVRPPSPNCRNEEAATEVI